ncbi:MAG TPA: hypothetical protein VFE36_04510 [Candidatus Baltobacteraceae bacterium]|nr:hypothetical protein [Candidatus Baltobacteraceae bacterium]
MCLRRLFFLSSACLGLALPTAGCSNGAGTGAFGPQPARIASDLTAFAPASLGGIVNTRKFSVPSGKTVTVSRNAAIFASTAVTIAGTLKVPRGVSVAFFTPSFTIASTGSIVPVTNAKYPGPTHDLVSACQIDVANLWEVGAGDSLGITSSVKRNATPGHPCSVVLALRTLSGNQSSIVLDPGVPGGSDPHRYIGQNGGWIVIGSAQAISLTQALAKRDGHSTLRAFAPDVVTIDSLLAAGNGGKGRPDDLGTIGGGGYDFSPSAGGIGGSVQIAAGSIGGTMPHIAAGNGGNGGDLAFGFDDYPYSLDGTLTSPNGISATLSMASGGGGGGIFIVAKTPKSIWERAGDGGNPSTIGANGTFAAGSGWPQFALPANAPLSGTSIGGSLTVELALPGSKGPHGNNKPTKPKNGKFGNLAFDGGWGSAWINISLLPTPAPGTSAHGGQGGTLTLVPPPHITVDKLRAYGLAIDVFNFGNGGPSELLCGAAVAGITGGNAGTMHDNGLFAYMNHAGAPSFGFNGGQGSSGTPPGIGGPGGKNDEGATIGAQGAAGPATC